MNLRTRILLTSLTAALVPFLVLGLALRKELGSRFTEADAAGAAVEATRIDAEVDAAGRRVERSLQAIARWIRDEPDLRRAIETATIDPLATGVDGSTRPNFATGVDGSTRPNFATDVDGSEGPAFGTGVDHPTTPDVSHESASAAEADPSGPNGTTRRRVQDIAVNAMPISGLSFLELLDEHGRILSSGQFRQDHGGNDAPLLRLPIGSLALVEARRPDGTILCLARRHTFGLAGREYTLVGGIDPAEVIPWFPPEDRSNGDSGTPNVPSAVVVTVVRANETPAGDALKTRSIMYLPKDAPPEAASLVFFTTESSDARLQDRFDRWLMGALAASLAGSLALALLLAEQVSRPIRALTEKTTRVELRGSRFDLESDRSDEVGELSRFVASMIDRLRTSAQQLQDSERRAALGDVARQVNHDVRGGIAPIRHVVRHLSSLAESDPSELAKVYRERERTLEASLAYLEELATRYAKLSPRAELRAVDLSSVLEQVVATMPVPANARLRVEGTGHPVWIRADALGLRRIVENLTRNALEALPEGRGEVTIRVAPSNNESMVRLQVQDTGAGIPEADREKIFEPFYSTRDRGTGLGLGIVRRLVMDCEARLDLVSEEGRGTTVTVTFETADPLRADVAESRPATRSRHRTGNEGSSLP